jgi:hypothetical protein
MTTPSPRIHAIWFLTAAEKTLIQRAEQRDCEQERSMARAVQVFNAITGLELTELNGWVFMVALKLARSRGEYKDMDDWIDLTAYAALAAECGSKLPTQPENPHASE